MLRCAEAVDHVHDEAPSVIGSTHLEKTRLQIKGMRVGCCFLALLSIASQIQTGRKRIYELMNFTGLEHSMKVLFESFARRCVGTTSSCLPRNCSMAFWILRYLSQGLQKPGLRFRIFSETGGVSFCGVKTRLWSSLSMETLYVKIRLRRACVQLFSRQRWTLLLA